MANITKFNNIIADDIKLYNPANESYDGIVATQEWVSQFTPAIYTVDDMINMVGKVEASKIKIIFDTSVTQAFEAYGFDVITTSGGYKLTFQGGPPSLVFYKPDGSSETIKGYNTTDPWLTTELIFPADAGYITGICCNKVNETFSDTTLKTTVEKSMTFSNLNYDIITVDWLKENYAPLDGQKAITVMKPGTQTTRATKTILTGAELQIYPNAYSGAFTGYHDTGIRYTGTSLGTGSLNFPFLSAEAQTIATQEWVQAQNFGGDIDTSNLVTLDSEQTISGTKHFANTVYIGNNESFAPNGGLLLGNWGITVGPDVTDYTQYQNRSVFVQGNTHEGDRTFVFPLPNNSTGQGSSKTETIATREWVNAQGFGGVDIGTELKAHDLKLFSNSNLESMYLHMTCESLEGGNYITRFNFNTALVFSGSYDEGGMLRVDVDGIRADGPLSVMSDLNLTNATVTINGTPGEAGQVLVSTGDGVEWKKNNIYMENGYLYIDI